MRRNIILLTTICMILSLLACSNVRNINNDTKLYDDFIKSKKFDRVYAIGWIDGQVDNDRYADFQKYEITDFDKDGIPELFIIYKDMTKQKYSISRYDNAMQMMYSSPFIKESYTIKDGNVVPYKYNTDYGSGAHWDYYCFLLNDGNILEFVPGGYMSNSFNVVNSNGIIKTFSYETPDHVNEYYKEDGKEITLDRYCQLIEKYLKE